jgi:transmembrane sensor
MTATLGPGQQVSYGDRGLGAVSMTDPAVVTAWQRGVLIFRDVPLAQVIAEVNRYRPGRIILANRALAERKVVAGFRLDRIDDAVKDLTRSLGVQTRSLPGGIVLLS